MLSRLRVTTSAWISALRATSTRSNLEDFDAHCDPQNPKDLHYSQVKQAYERIKDGIVNTNCEHSVYFSKLMGCDVYFKKENKQRTGSFKERGARNALMALSEENRKKGVFVGSNGNYALAIACHAKQLGVPATVVVPRFIPLHVISLCKDFGAKVVVEGKNHVESKRLAFKLAKEQGGTFIDGHDHIDIIAGAGSIAIEVLQQVKDVGTVVVPVGGGGLLAGVCVAIKELSPQTKIVAVEPEASPCFSSAMKSGQSVRIKAKHSLASALVVSRAGYNSFHIAKDKIDKIVNVKEESLALAVLRMLEQEKTVVEGAAALGPAALLEGSIQGDPGKNIVCILSGGNIDSTVVGRSVEKGLLADDRLVMFEVFVPDRPGSICELFEITNRTGGSVKDISMEHVFHQFGMFTLKMKIVVETRGLEHSKDLNNVLYKRYGDDLRFYMRRKTETKSST